MTRTTSSLHRGFTLVELGGVVLIVGLLIMMLLPAVQSAREQARRTQCRNNLGQLGLAVAGYESAHGVLPPGVVNPTGPIRDQPDGYHMGWMVQILPFLEERPLYESVDFSVGVYEPANDKARLTDDNVFRCPSSPLPGTGLGSAQTNYAACHHHVEAPIDADNQGMFFLNSSLRTRDVPDGAAHTIYLGEKAETDSQGRRTGNEFDRGWMSGTRATLRNTGTPINQTSLAPDYYQMSSAVGDSYPGFSAPPSRPPPSGLFGWEEPESSDGAEARTARADRKRDLFVGGFGSFHPNGANFVFGDGSVRTLFDDIDLGVYQQLGHRADGKLLTYRSDWYLDSRR